jgi:hypothetical protein
MEFFGSRAESLLFKDRKQVAKMPKFSPLVHTPKSPREPKVFSDRQLSAFISCGNRDSVAASVQ